MAEALFIIENFNESSGLHTEDGLSLFIKQDNEHYLLDTGAPGKFIENTQK